MSNSVKKKLIGIGYKTDQEFYEVRGFLLGQLGKNYSEIAVKAKAITGNELLSLACIELKKAYEVVGGRILYLEWENHPKIVDFYERNGFRKLEDFKSVNNQLIMVRKLDDL